MKAFLKFDIPTLAKKILEEKLQLFDVKFQITGFGEIEFFENLNEQKLQAIIQLFLEYGIEVIENQKTILVQKIKDAIHEMIFQDVAIGIKSSVYLAEKLNHSYGYLSNLTYTSINLKLI
ncbi:hypothetical protein [Flavobacterium sp.]|jgi:hypothetical protein|uniref:hypothetical protein n=1 Tax=Flavobacterium sp. TaxID=239 RepID=UPI0037BF62CA